MIAKFLHTNDLHGKLTLEIAQKIASLRKDGDFYFDSGDAIQSGNLAITLKPEKAWPLLSLAECDASTIGNRETHISKFAFEQKLKGLSHPIVCCNIVDSKTEELVFPESIIIEKNDIRVGVIGVSVPMVTKQMISKNASAFLWISPAKSLERAISNLKGDVDIVTVLSHLGHRQDQELAAKIPGINIIFGGHSHVVLEQPELVEKTYIVQGGSHARFIGEYEFDLASKKLTGWLTPLKVQF